MAGDLGGLDALGTSTSAPTFFPRPAAKPHQPHDPHRLPAVQACDGSAGGHGLTVQEVRFHPAATAERRRGLLGWVTCLVADLWLDGLAVRRTSAGQVALVYPARADRRGRRHATVRPRDERARAEIEAQVIAALRERGYVA